MSFLFSGTQVLQALAARPGGPELIELADAREDLALVGGAVRDLLLGREPRELDVVLDGDAQQLAGELAAKLEQGGAAGVSVTAHERFGTAMVQWDGGRVDIARRRAETYSSCGALPDVQAGDSLEDLARRDFTVNAIAVALGGTQRGELMCAEHGIQDLTDGQLRVLHEHSFLDDPTRLLRLARYSARLGFGVEQRTAQLASAALAVGALSSVSRARVGAELRLALGERDAVAALGALDRLGVLAAIQPGMSFDAALAGRALALLPDDGSPCELLLASTLLDVASGGVAGGGEAKDVEPVVYELLDALEFTAGRRERVLRSVLAASTLPAEMLQAMAPSQLGALLRPYPIEAVALAGAVGDADEPAERWLSQLRHVRLEIDGDDLLAAGVASGPDLGRRLDAVLALKLDGRLAPGRDAELQAALEIGP